MTVIPVLVLFLFASELFVEMRIGLTVERRFHSWWEIEQRVGRK